MIVIVVVLGPAVGRFVAFPVGCFVAFPFMAFPTVGLVFAFVRRLVDLILRSLT